MYFPDKKSTSNQLKRTKLEKENPENKLQKSAQSNKSSRINNVEKKRQCRNKKSIQNISISSLLIKTISNYID